MSDAPASSNGDGYDFAVKGGRIVGVRGRADGRIDHGRLGPKDLYGWQANASPDRLTAPLVRDGDRLVEASWDETMGRIVRRSRKLLRAPGGWGRFGFYRAVSSAKSRGARWRSRPGPSCRGCARASA